MSEGVRSVQGEALVQVLAGGCFASTILLQYEWRCRHGGVGDVYLVRWG